MADDGKWELSREESNARVRKQNAEKGYFYTLFTVSQ